MKKYIFIILSIICFAGCGTEDKTVDITVMPPVTNTGANTFGCLIDGWAYVGGRYHVLSHDNPWTLDAFEYYQEENKLYASVVVKEDLTISFTIHTPQAGKESVITDIKFGEEELEDGTILITHLDMNAEIISGTFGNNKRLTKGRLDIHFITFDKRYQ